ncbi:MAG: glycosyltransferase family 39 protein [Verrucomicrobiia bacterium]
MNRQERIRTAVVLGVFAIVFCVLTVSSYRQKSATWDEPQHVAAGYAAWIAGDYRADPEHPPFLRMWATIPLLFRHDVVSNPDAIAAHAYGEWLGQGQFAFCHQFLYKWNDADQLLYAARFMIVLLGVLLGVMVFCWARELFGFWSAVAALSLYTFEPNILAHSSLVTTDFGVTCFIFGAVYFTWRIARRITISNMFGLAVFFALAEASKFSAFLLAPVLLVLLLARACRGLPWSIGAKGELRSRRARIGVAFGIFVCLCMVAYLAVWATYGFRYAPVPGDPAGTCLQTIAFERERVPRLATLMDWTNQHRLLPNAYTEGLLLGQAKAQMRGAFLAGHYSVVGWWYYFPVAFLIKTPLAVILLLLAGLAICVARWRALLRDDMFLLLPVIVYLGAAIAVKMNIGLRHILPIYPFALLLAALAVSELLRSKQKCVYALLVALSLLWLFEFARVYPHYLAFFNQFVGGPRNGYEYLADSNLDWGQDLKPLKRWMDEHGVQHINLAYFGTADPAYYGIQCTYLPGSPFFAERLVQPPQLPGYVAVSATILDGVYLSDLGREFYKRLLAQKPVAVIGYSIYIYRMDKPWW